MQIEILYFAWVRERVGRSKETIETDALTVAQLVDQLISRDPAYGVAFKDLSQIKVAVSPCVEGRARFESGPGLFTLICC